jgi:hypothetical protein
MGEIERTHWFGREQLAAREGANALERITHAGWSIEAELDRVETQRIRVAGEQKDANGERGSSNIRHAIKLTAIGRHPKRCRMAGRKKGRRVAFRPAAFDRFAPARELHLLSRLGLAWLIRHQRA